MNKTELLTIAQAHKLVRDAGFKISRVTLYNWAFKHKIGYQAGGPGARNPWRFYKNKLQNFIQGKE